MSLQNKTALSAPGIRSQLLNASKLLDFSKPLIEILTGETHLSTAGFPYISAASFGRFTSQIPHLFGQGLAILDGLERLALFAEKNIEKEGREWESCLRGIRVVRNMVFTAAITAPPDLWILRQIFSLYRRLGLLEPLREGLVIRPLEFAREKGFDGDHLCSDLHMLHARGYLDRDGKDGFVMAKKAPVPAVFESITALPDVSSDHLIQQFAAFFKGEKDVSPLDEWLLFEAESDSSGHWVADLHCLEIGYRLLPVVLGLRSADLTGRLKKGVSLDQAIGVVGKPVEELFTKAGLVRGGDVTHLGARVFQRGPGPFGIIGAYYPYLNQLELLLKGEKAASWVSRGENVAASQDANRKTFLAANLSLDAFCREYDFEYKVFIEHAVGKGEATRQRYEQNPDLGIRYFGADLEDAAIDEAVKVQTAGLLPPNMEFIRNADIGLPERITGYLRQRGVASHHAVMMVGNGFHEIRQQTNEKMVAVLRGYCEAGILIIFTEESALSDEDLIKTGWNTYHAGFRYVHDLSGQGLRPAYDFEGSEGRWSWLRCAHRAGYVVLEKFSPRTRTIFPYKKSKHTNPSISVTYFCVPRALAESLSCRLLAEEEQ